MLTYLPAVVFLFHTEDERTTGRSMLVNILWIKIIIKLTRDYRLFIHFTKMKLLFVQTSTFLLISLL